MTTESPDAGAEYTRENQEEQRDADEEQLHQDLQEARSIYQAMSISLVWLSSGKWACIYGNREIEIMETLDEDWMRSTAMGERELHERRREQSGIVESPVISTGKNLEDMGL